MDQFCSLNACFCSVVVIFPYVSPQGIAVEASKVRMHRHADRHFSERWGFSRCSAFFFAYETSMKATNTMMQTGITPIGKCEAHARLTFLDSTSTRFLTIVCQCGACPACSAKGSCGRDARIAGGGVSKA